MELEAVGWLVTFDDQVRHLDQSTAREVWSTRYVARGVLDGEPC